MPPQTRLIAFGGIIGALLRWGIIGLANERTALAVVFLNVAGSFLIGVLLGKQFEDTTMWPFAALGFCGGLTTFSTFALDVARRLNGDGFSVAAGVLVSTVVLAVVAAGLGYRIGHRSIHRANMPYSQPISYRR